MSAGECATGRCQIHDVFQLFSKAHMLDVLHVFIAQADGPLRFNEVEERLEVSPNTLTVRLKELVGAGILERRAYNEIPPRVEYEATEKAEALCPIFEAITAWANSHDLAPVPTG